MSRWDRLPDEPANWYARFEAYRLAGPQRTLEGVWTAEAKRSKAKRPGSDWYQAAKRWRWQERAEAWDAAQREEARSCYAAQVEAGRLRWAALTAKALAKAERFIDRLDPEACDPGTMLKLLKQAWEISCKLHEDLVLVPALAQVREMAARDAEQDRPSPG